MADQKNAKAAWQSPEAFDLLRSEFEPAPPAYNSLVASPQPLHDPHGDFVSCCAFERLNAITHPSNHNGFHRTPQLRLIGWVVLCRSTDESLTQEQRLSCPLAGCDVQFSEDEHMQLVNHVSACRHLAEGEYLCPYHNEIENFMTPAHQPHGHRSKRQFLKRTIGKIRRLGSRSSKHASSISFGPGESSHADSDDEQKRNSLSTSNKRPRLDQISAPIVTEPIIHAPFFCTAPAPVSAAPAPAPVELCSSEVLELDAWTGPSLTEPPCLDPFQSLPAYSQAQPIEQYQELPAAEHMSWEMDTPASFPSIWDINDNRFSNSSWASASDSVFTVDNSLSPVSPISRDSYFSIDGFDCPVTQADAPQFAQQPVNNPFRRPNSHGENAPQVSDMGNLTLSSSPPNIPLPVERKSPRPIPSIRVDTSFNTARPVHQTSSPFSSDGSSFDSPVSETSENRDSGLFTGSVPVIHELEAKNPRSLVTELRGLFNTLFKMSLQKLCADPANAAGRRVLGWNASPAMLFESGMRALQKVVNGEMPSDVTGIFGLSLLTYACGLADMDFSMPEHFSTIFEEQLRWSCAIENDAERNLYTNLIHQLWAPNERASRRSLPFATSNHFDAGMAPPTSAPLGNWSEWNSGPSFDFNSMHMQDAAGQTGVGPRPSSACLNGAAIGLCQRFLDNFEYLLVDLNELNCDVQATPDFGLEIPTEIADPSTVNHDILMSSVIQPLASNPALQSFMSVVKKASILLEALPHMPLRNTELWLVQESKKHPTSQLLRELFTLEVHRLSNEASDVLGCGPSFRSYYYNRDVDNILAIHDSLLGLEAIGRHQRSRSSSLSSYKGKAAVRHSPTSTNVSDRSWPSPPPQRPWSLELQPVSSRTQSPRESAVFHSRQNSYDDMFGLGIEPPSTVNPAFTVTFPAVGDLPASSASTPAPRTGGIRTPRTQPRGRRRKAAAGSRAATATAPPSIGGTHPPAATGVSPPLVIAAGSPPAAAGGKASLASSPTTAGPDGKATQSCSICGQRFEGKAQWIRANVTRHVREKHRGTAKRLECGALHCTYSSTRRGNLTHHRRTVHGVED